MLNREIIYDIVYALAARDGREAVLFGDCAPLAHAAFARSCAGPAFPEVWFEIPLAGDPWFDLHALTSRDTLEAGMRFSPDETGGYPEIFEWFASAPDVRQLALSYDVSRGNIEQPAVQLLVSKPQMHEPFLELAGGQDAVQAYRLFAQRLPQEWFACYTGLFPGRPNPMVRVECIPNEHLQHAYAQDASLLGSHLRKVGLEDIEESIVPRCQLLSQMPFQLEFQFDVLMDGSLGETFSASSRFSSPADDGDWEPFDTSGAADELMEQVQNWGLADERWRLLADTMFANHIARGDQSAILACYPAFVKLRWRAGKPLDAKAYLIILYSDETNPSA